jgi:hypothetical protein
MALSRYQRPQFLCGVLTTFFEPKDSLNASFKTFLRKLSSSSTRQNHRNHLEPVRSIRGRIFRFGAVRNRYIFGFLHIFISQSRRDRLNSHKDAGCIEEIEECSKNFQFFRNLACSFRFFGLNSEARCLLSLLRPCFFFVNFPGKHVCLDV